MKTMYNVQKTIFNLLVVISCLIFGIKSADAQKLWKPVWNSNSTDNLAVALLKTKVKTDSENLKVKSSFSPAMLAEFSVIEEEVPLELEEWMINENVFNSKTYQQEKGKEPFHKLESWIREENPDKAMDSKQDKIKDFCLPEKEPELALESWMIQDNFWE